MSWCYKVVHTTTFACETCLFTVEISVLTADILSRLGAWLGFSTSRCCLFGVEVSEGALLTNCILTIGSLGSLILGASASPWHIVSLHVRVGDKRPVSILDHLDILDTFLQGELHTDVITNLTTCPSSSKLAPWLEAPIPINSDHLTIHD